MSENVSVVKVWLTAARPFSYPASITPVIVGLALADYAGFSISWFLFAVTLIGLICFQTVGNLLNDVFDHQRGLDTQVFPMSGAVVRGWLTKKQVYVASGLLLWVGVSCGLVLVHYAGLVILLIGLAGLLLTLTYTTPRFCFKYVGLGDLLIYLCFGLLPMYGAWWVQTQTHSWLPVLWSLPATCFTIGILHANNWRDIETDAGTGCRTVAVRLGEKGSETYYKALLIMPFVLVALYVAVGLIYSIEVLAPLTAGAVVIVLALVVKLLKVSRDKQNPEFVMLDGLTARAQMAFAIILTLSIAFG